MKSPTSVLTSPIGAGTIPLNVRYYGKDTPLPAQTELRAGRVSATFEEGYLLNIFWGEHEILRRIYVAVRDRNWGTVPGCISDLKIDAAATSFHVSYTMEHRQDEIRFIWSADIIGNSDGNLTFSLKGKAQSTFLRNRIGFCLLHPVETCAGKVFSVKQHDGSVRSGIFPKTIATEQPLPNTESMRALSFQIESGVEAEIQFSGDIFQMEDQRNWTDATFKTFCTPLSLPYPVEIQAGDEISQSIVLTLKDQRINSPVTSEKSATIISVGQKHTVALPRIGVGMASDGYRLTDQEVDRLKMLRFSHLRVELDLANPIYAAMFVQAVDESKRLGVPLEIAVLLSNSPQFELLVLSQMVRKARPDVITWLIFDGIDGEDKFAVARQLLQPITPSAQFGGGTNGPFVDLNKPNHSFRPLDLVAYSIQPQTHAFDNASLVETLEIQAATVTNLRELVGGRPIAVSPITLKSRLQSGSDNISSMQLPPQVDVRLMSLFGAGWTLGSLKYLAESGTQSLTYYETTGWRGVIERETGTPLPDQFRSLPRSVFPLYHVLADVGEFHGGHVIPTHSTQPLKVVGMTLLKNEEKRILLANLSVESQHLVVEGLSQLLRITEINEHNVVEAMTLPEEFRAQAGKREQTNAGRLALMLLPYAITRIDAA